ncbi:SCO family protein [Lewinella sp. JB7]|uniref:SCO family protein n=1 Tax=Lewinella sp. JB7 TaxID=2962887 RepID=UPI0020C9694F|nr:SCO family protein [Lewinella sp. JB7]MCP9236285.1 SCO family protein [Lewinella sp. JB7]
MKKYAMPSKSFLTALGLLLMLSCGEADRSEAASLPYYREATFTPHWFTADSDSLADFHQISPFRLVDQLGDTVTEAMLADKIYVANFFFTACPGICPKMTNNMTVLQDAFREVPDVKLLSHSVTPNYDSVAVLRNYAESNGVDAGTWHLLTGDRDQIYRLGRQDYFAEEDLGLEREQDDFLHTENFVLVDRDRHIRGIYNGLSLASVDQLTRDIRTLLAER